MHWATARPSHGDDSHVTLLDHPAAADHLVSSDACTFPVAGERATLSTFSITSEDQSLDVLGRTFAVVLMRGYGTNGRLMQNVAPPPGLFAAHTRPPWPSTMERVIESPIPSPPFLVV